MAKRKKRKLTKAERRAIALRNLRKAHRGRKARGKGYKPRALSRRRFKKKRVGIKRFGRSRGAKVKVLTTGERRRRTRRRKNPIAAAALAANPLGERRRRRRSRRKNPWHGQPRRHAKAAKLGHARRRRRGKRKVRKSTGHSHSSKRSRAAKKAARTRARNKALRSAAAKKAARSRKRRHGGSKKKRSSGRRKTARKSSRKSASGPRKSPKRVKAAKKAARTRARNKSRNKRAYKRAGGRRYTPASHQLTAERRTRRRSRRRNPLVNPLPNPMRDLRGFLAKAAGFGVGYLIQDSIDRFAATHALAVDSNGNVTDTPPAGTIFDSESPDLPIWSSWQRLAFNAAGLAVPGILGRFFWKEFWNRAFAAAAIRTIGKVAVDTTTHFMTPNAMALRLYGANYAAQAKLNTANAGALPASPAGVFAGIPRFFGVGGPQRPAPRQLAAPQRKLGDCGDCGSGSSAIMTDPTANSPAASLLAPTPSNCGCAPFNPLTAGTGPSNDVINVTPQPVAPPSGGNDMIPVPVTVITSTPATAPQPSGGGSGSGNGSGNCSRFQIQSWLSAIAQFNGNGTTPHKPTYDGMAGQLAACGVNVPAWTPPPAPPAPPAVTTTVIPR